MNEFVGFQLEQRVKSVGEDFDELVLLMCSVNAGEVAIAEFNSKPASVEVWRGKEFLGTTAVPLRLEPGFVTLTFKAPGYRSLEQEFMVSADEPLEAQIELEESNAAVFGRSWKNDIGMQFVPLGDELLFGVHEVTRGAFRKFVTEKGRSWEQDPLTMSNRMITLW